MCNATRKTFGPNHFHNFRPGAPHRSTLIGHREYMEGCAREAAQPSHLFRCPGLLIDYITVDVMHAGDLGTFQDAVGSLFWLEVNNKQWYPRQSAGLAELNRNLNQYYAAHQDQNLSKVMSMRQHTPIPFAWPLTIQNPVGLLVSGRVFGLEYIIAR